MNSKTLEVVPIPEGAPVPEGHVVLSSDEARDLGPMNRKQRRDWLRTNRVGYGQSTSSRKKKKR